MRGRILGIVRTLPLVVLVLSATVLGSACVFSIGRSVEQRELVVQRFGSGPHGVLLIGGLHTGGEDNSRIVVEQIAAYFAARPEAVPPSVTFYVLPSANPDGTARGTHTNASGIDLNRNWPADDWAAHACHPRSGCRSTLGGPQPLSEPETAALYRLIETMRPEITAVWHARASLVEANEVPGADAYAQTFAAAAGYAYVDEWSAYRITGQLIDALEQRLGLRAFDVELSQCCEITPEEFDANLAGVLALLVQVDRNAARPAGTPTARPSSPSPSATVLLPPFAPTPKPTTPDTDE